MTAHCSASANGAPLGIPPGTKRMAILVRGRFFGEGILPSSTGRGLLQPYSWDFLSRTWPALHANVIAPAQSAGIHVDVFLGTYETVTLPERNEWWQRVLAAVRPKATYLFNQQFVDTQWYQGFTLLAQWQNLNKANYDLLLMTRADFMFDGFAWPTLSQCFNPQAVNVQQTVQRCPPGDSLGYCPGRECWVDDMVHFLSMDKFTAFTNAVSMEKKHAHRLGSSIGFGNLHILSPAFGGQPDRCRPLLGTLDRGLHNPPPAPCHCPALTLLVNSSMSRGSNQTHRESHHSIQKDTLMFTRGGSAKTWSTSLWYLFVVMGMGIGVFFAGSQLAPMFPLAYIGVMACLIYMIFSISIDLVMASLRIPEEDRKGQEYAFNPLSVILTTEMVKLVASAVIFIITPSISRGGGCGELQFDDVKWLSLPAIIFTLNNILVFKAIGNNDISTFAVLRDTMVLWTACMWRCWFFENLGWKRDLAILAIIMGALMKLFYKYEGGHWTWMFLWVVAMTFCNACGSVANEFALKRNKSLDINIQNMVLYMMCIACTASFILALDRELLTSLELFFSGFDKATWILVGLQSLAGLMVSRLLKHADSVMKTAATSLRAPLLVFLAPLWVTSSFDTITIVSAILTSVGSFVYLTQPPLKAFSDDTKPDDLPKKEEEATAGASLA